MAGNSVVMAAGHDVGITAGQVAAQTGVTLEAGNDVTVQSA